MTGGYRAVIETDRFQIYLIKLGVASIAILAGIKILNVGLTDTLNIFKTTNPFTTASSAAAFVGETLLGFLFSQLLYYDNWQRLSAYFKASINHRFNGDASRENCEKLIKEIQHTYTTGSLWLFVVYVVPVVLGFTVLAGGTDLTVAGLFGGLKETATEIPVLGHILLICSVLMMACALMSTADTYCLGATDALVRGVFKPLNKDQNGERRQFGIARVFSFMFTVSLIPVLLLEPNWGTFFLYLFYSANGFVGPILFAVLGKKLNGTACKVAIVLGFVYPAISFISPGLAKFAPYPGILPVAASLLLVGATSKPNSQHV